MIIIPVYQTKPLFRLFPGRAICISRYFVISAVCIGCDVHVAPDHRLQAKLLADGKHTFAMLPYKNRTFLITVFFQVFSKSQKNSFIHAKMYPACRKRFLYTLKELLNKCVGFFFSHNKNIRGILNFIFTRPLQSIMQMRQCLNAGNQLDSKHGSVCIHLLDFSFCIASAVAAEIGFSRYFVGIFCIQHQYVHSHFGKCPNDRFYFFYCKHSISGAVQHKSVPFKIYRFLIFICICI